MPIPYDEQYAEKHSIVKELFIATADDNYIAARWCFHENLNVDFFWLAVHCVEKYLKASLLLNGKSAKKLSHNIVNLFPAVKALAPELLPNVLTKPKEMADPYWHDETTDRFVERLYRDGQAHNRYQLYGYSRHAEDLLKLDQLVFHIRWLCQPLEVHFLGKKYDGMPDQSKRERMLRDHPSSWNLSCKLEETIEGKRGEVLRHALLNLNFPFVGEDYPHTEISYIYASQNPVLVRRLYDPLEAGPAHFQKADELWSWVKSNIFLPDNLIEEIELARAALKAKASTKPA
jgi:HEPN domain-containing protein